MDSKERSISALDLFLTSEKISIISSTLNCELVVPALRRTIVRTFLSKGFNVERK